MQSSIFILVLFLAFTSSFAQSGIKDSASATDKYIVKNLNKQIRTAKTCFFISGIAFIAGSMVTISATNKDIPNENNYTDPYKYESDMNAYNNSQKSMKKTSAYLYALGGAGMIISGVALKTVNLKKMNLSSLKLKTGLNQFAICYNF